MLLEDVSRAVELPSTLLENAGHQNEAPCGLALVVPEEDDNTVARKSDYTPYELYAVGSRT